MKSLQKLNPNLFFSGTGENNHLVGGQFNNKLEKGDDKIFTSDFFNFKCKILNYKTQKRHKDVAFELISWNHLKLVPDNPFGIQHQSQLPFAAEPPIEGLIIKL